MSQPSCLNFEGDVFVGIGAAVAAGFGFDADGVGFFDPLFGREREAIQPGLFSKPLEFEGFKIGVVQLLPDSKKLNRVTVAQPILDDVVDPIRFFIARDIRDADEIRFVASLHRDFAVEHFDFRHEETPVYAFYPEL